LNRHPLRLCSVLRNSGLNPEWKNARDGEHGGGTNTADLPPKRAGVRPDLRLDHGGSSGGRMFRARDRLDRRRGVAKGHCFGLAGLHDHDIPGLHSRLIQAPPKGCVATEKINAPAATASKQVQLQRGRADQLGSGRDEQFDQPSARPQVSPGGAHRLADRQDSQGGKDGRVDDRVRAQSICRYVHDKIRA